MKTTIGRASLLRLTFACFFFDFDLENQLFPARGWAVLRVNYRGSTSYGEQFSRAKK